MTCACGNAARYINERGELCCGTCPVRDGLDSIRITDVGGLLAWAREVSAELDEPRRHELQSMIGRKP